jgi:hypothetical protein
MRGFVAKTPRLAASAPGGAIGLRLFTQTSLGSVALRLPAGMTRRPAVVVLRFVPGGGRNSARSALLHRLSRRLGSIPADWGICLRFGSGEVCAGDKHQCRTGEQKGFHLTPQYCGGFTRLTRIRLRSGAFYSNISNRWA